MSCHQDYYDKWEGSHHDLAMDVATEDTVLGDFSKPPFSQRDGRFYVETDGAEHEIQYVFGVEPLQQYLIETDRGHIQTLQLSWDTEKKRWFMANDDFHWTSSQFNWNMMCAECHSTNLQKNYDEKSRSYNTTWTEIDVSCQACHGPGSRHVDKPQEPYRIKSEIDACARCHSRRTIVSGEYEHNKPFMDHYAPALLEERLYFPDGQIKDEVYVYGSFIQTKKYKAGVTCTNCHDPHTARLKFSGNALCAQCHQEKPPEAFKTLTAKLYDTPKHHFHKSEPIRCVDCHMPARKYMVVDPRRDHSFRVPRPDLSVKLGTPNSCNVCHADKTAQWAADAVEKWYPDSEKRGAHFGEALATGKGLRELALDKEQPAIARATAIRRLPPIPELLKDDDPIVRAAAIAAFDGRPNPALLRPLLKDPIRGVRVEAARVLTEDLDEFRRRQAAQIERPEAHLNLGVMHERLGDPKAAEREYLEAISLDGDFLPVRFNLTNLLNAQGRNAEAEKQLRAILKRAPRNGEAHYSMGLLLVEMRRPGEAVTHLAEAAARLKRARASYNYGLLLLQLRRARDAEAAFLNALRIAARDPDTLKVLVGFYTQREEWKKALPYAERLGDARLVQQIRAQIR